MGPVHLLETPETYEAAHAGPHDRIWAKAERKKVEGLLAVWTFVEKKGTWQRGTNIISAKSGCMRGRRMSLVKLCVLTLG